MEFCNSVDRFTEKILLLTASRMLSSTSNPVEMLGLPKSTCFRNEDINDINVFFFINWFCGVVGYHFCLTHRRSPVRTRAESSFCQCCGMFCSSIGGGIAVGRWKKICEASETRKVRARRLSATPMPEILASFCRSFTRFGKWFFSTVPTNLSSAYGLSFWWHFLMDCTWHQWELDSRWLTLVPQTSCCKPTVRLW